MPLKIQALLSLQISYVTRTRRIYLFLVVGYVMRDYMLSLVLFSLITIIVAV
jgi:hypothetical protein